VSNPAQNRGPCPVIVRQSEIRASSERARRKVKLWNRIVRLSVDGWRPHGNSLERCWRYLDRRSRTFDHKGCAHFAG